MSTIDVYTARDLRNRAGELLKNAEEGNLALITKHGRPAAVSMPFDSVLLEQGVNRRFAVQLFEQGLAGLSQAAKIALLSIEEFIAVLGASGVTVVDTDPNDLEHELEYLR